MNFIILCWFVFGYISGFVLATELYIKGKNWSQINFFKFFGVFVLGILCGPFTYLYLFRWLVKGE